MSLGKFCCMDLIWIVFHRVCITDADYWYQEKQRGNMSMIGIFSLFEIIIPVDLSDVTVLITVFSSGSDLKIPEEYKLLVISRL